MKVSQVADGNVVVRMRVGVEAALPSRSGRGERRTQKTSSGKSFLALFLKPYGTFVSAAEV